MRLKLFSGNNEIGVCGKFYASKTLHIKRRTSCIYGLVFWTTLESVVPVLSNAKHQYMGKG